MKHLARLLIGLLVASTAHASYLSGYSQGSTTSGQSGFLNQGAVTTSSPSYTNGQTSPFTLTLAGALRTDSSAVTQPAVFNDGVATGNITTQNLNPSSGTATTGSTVAITGLNGAGTLVIGVTGTYTGALSVQVSADGSNWITIPSVINLNTNALTATIPSAAVGVWQASIGTMNAVRVTALSAVTGTAAVVCRVGVNDFGITVEAPLPAGTNSIGGVTLPDLAITGQGSQTTLNNNIVLATAGATAQSAAGYHSWSIEIVPAAGTVTAGNVTFQGSNDNVNFQPIYLYDQNAPNAAPVSTYAVVAATNRFFKGPLNWTYVKAILSTGITGTSTGVQAFTVFSTLPFTPDQPQVVSATAANNAVTATISGTPAVTVSSGTVTTVSTLSGGPTAVGGSFATSPLITGGADSNSKVRATLTSPLGELQDFGAGESVTPFAVGTGAASVTDGTNGKTINLLPGKEGDVYLYVSGISTSPTLQFEISYDNSTFAIVPMTRIDNTAASQQFASVAAFTPVAGAVYRGKTYGAALGRVHLVAGSATNTVGTVRVQYQPELPGVLVSPFAFQSSGTTEAVGIANGQVWTGSVRTLTVPTKGSTVATLFIEANTGGSNVVALEGSQDYGTTWNALPLQPITGGATVTSFTNTGTAALPGTAIYQCDVSNQTQVRAHCTTYASGAIYGYLKLVNVPSANPPTSRHPTYTASVTGAVTTTTNVLGIASGSAKTTTVKRVTVNFGTATAAAQAQLTLVRSTVAAIAGGTSITAATMQHNPADAAFSGSALQGISSAITTTGATLTNTSTVIPGSVTSAAPNPNTVVFDLTNGGQCEGYQIPVGTTNALLFSVNGTTGGANLVLNVDFTEE